MNRPHAQRSRVLVPTVLALALLGAVAWTYAEVRTLAFVDFDDFAYVPGNPAVMDGLDPASIRWAFSSIHAGYWAPLLWISYMADTALFGPEPAGYHLTNAALHAVNVLLVFGLLTAGTGRPGPAAAAAALFALHPVQVESVAWVTERKNVLSTVFGLASIGAYGLWTRRLRARTYVVALALMAASLMVKGTFVTLPLLLLIVDVWPLRRLALRDREAWSTRLREKIPFLALSLLAAAITFVAQREGGAVADVRQLGLEARVENAVVSHVRYLGMLLWPTDLAVLYPYPSLLGVDMWSARQVGAAVLLLAGLTLGAFALGRRGPDVHPFPAGWCWFLLAMLPLNGLVQVGDHALADRHLYVPSLGIFVGLSFGIASRVRAGAPRGVLVLGLAIVLLALGIATRHQVRTWRDTLTLFEHALAVTEGNWIAANNVAWLRATCPDPRWRDGPRAVDLARQAVRWTREGEPDLLDTLAAAHAEAGDFEEARTWQRRAVAIARAAGRDPEPFRARLAQLARGQPVRSSQGCPVSAGRAQRHRGTGP